MKARDKLRLGLEAAKRAGLLTGNQRVALELAMAALDELADEAQAHRSEISALIERVNKLERK